MQVTWVTVDKDWEYPLAAVLFAEPERRSSTASLFLRFKMEASFSLFWSSISMIDRRNWSRSYTKANQHHA